MPQTSSETLLLRSSARPLDTKGAGLDPLIDLAGEASFVLLGEASHGTHEFYRTRATITQRLLAEKGFQAVAVEADWPDAWRVNQYVLGRAGADAGQALAGFTRFPVWMWRNEDVLRFVTWLRRYNERKAAQAGFYGLDLYSLYRSRAQVIRYLEKVDPEAARRAHNRYSCFDHFGEDEQAYGYAAAFNMSSLCEGEVIAQLTDLRRKAWEYAHRDGNVAEDEFLSAEQNARLIRNAEAYYRQMFQGRVNTWNLRDSHMAETLESLAQHLQRRFGRARIIVWAHNSHLGDARATERTRHGEWNLGQLVRQRRTDAILVGFTTWSGYVTAASEWGGIHETKRVRPALPGSYEALFHETGIPGFLLTFAGDDRLSSAFRSERLERAIGVIYRSETERISHYFQARLSGQFDAVVHFDETTALEPLPHAEEEQTAEVPETYPAGV